MQKVELLAPAGDMEALKVAINNGADAVYLGMQKFNARQKADNFTDDNIKDVVDYAHLFGVNVYLTVNTLVNNEEMPELLRTVKCAVDAKVDAFLVQDFGIAYALHKAFPNINLHASTQMGVHNLRGAKMAEKIGITRVVLSREVKLDDIIQIKNNTNLELEYFVQGALCVAFSGNCYFSAFATNDSGNRGMCKQLCRMKYSVKDTEDYKYLLSPADLCLIKNLKKLIDAGVCSFKIEGRLRRSGYVGQTVDSYRKAIDAIIKNKTIDIDDEIYKLRKVFSRGDFNYDAYLNNGVPDRIIHKDIQNHLGIKIGKVVDVKPFKDLSRVIIQSSQPLHNGDGLKFLYNDEEVVSVGVGNVDIIDKNIYAIYTKHKLKIGYDTYLILDSQLEQTYIDKVRQIPINIEVVAKVGKTIQCKISDNRASISCESQFVCEQAKNQPTTKEQIAEQFSKLGDTNFVCNDIKIVADNVFVPKSILNNLRRNAVQLFTNTILDTYKFVATDLNEFNTLCNLKFDNIGITEQQNAFVVDENISYKLPKNDLIVLSPSVYNVDIIDKFMSKYEGYNLALNLPVIANTYDLQILDKIIDKHPQLTLVANNIYGLDYIEEGRKVIAGTGLNVFNNFSKTYLVQLGVKNCVLSIEQSLDRYDFGNELVYSCGYVTLMNFCHCPFKTENNNTCKNCTYESAYTIKDTNGRTYSVKRLNISQCYFELLNSVLINNIGYHNQNKWIDLRGIDNIQGVIDALMYNRKISISDKDIIGKITKAVN